MSLIITATDFTEVAENAVNYACKLALANNADILVLHCYTIPIAYSEIPIPMPAIDAEKIAEDGMATLMKKLNESFPQLKISHKIIYGNIIDAIEDNNELNEKPLLVVTGNSYNEHNQAWMDSTLLQALRHLKYPVLAIPPETKYTQVRKIGFAYDNKYDGSDIALIELRELALTLGAELHIFFARHDVLKNDVEEEINAAAKQILAPADPLYHVFFESDIDTAILDFAAKYNVDWLIVMPRKHTFFQSLFHKSHTRLMINNSHIPVMALHHN